MIQTIWSWLSDPANWSGPGGITAQTLEHLRLSLRAVTGDVGESLARETFGEGQQVVLVEP